MSISSISAFCDPDDFESALRRCGVMRLVPVQAVRFRATLTDIRLTGLELMSGRESVSRAAIMSAPLDKILMVFPHTAAGAHYWAERRLRPGEFAVISEAAQVTWRICAPTSWGAILLPTQTLVNSLHTVFGAPAHLPPPGLTLWRPDRSAFGDLLRLHRAVMHYTVRRPEATVETTAAHALEQELITALIESLTDMSALGN